MTNLDERIEQLQKLLKEARNGIAEARKIKRKQAMSDRRRIACIIPVEYREALKAIGAQAEASYGGQLQTGIMTLVDLAAPEELQKARRRLGKA